MLRCAQMHRDHYPVGSSSSTKTYKVTMFRGDELPACTCTGFMTKRNKNANEAGGGFPGAGAGLARTTPAWCKHLEEVRNTTCAWEQATDETAPESCPRCGGPVVESTAPPLPAARGPVSTDEALGTAAQAGPDQATEPDGTAKPVEAAPVDVETAVAELTRLLGDA